ncbi:MAG: ribbon-helix-helix protein, CopG family [Gaiellaceae bacterium]
MRRIQVVMDPELDDRLEREAASRGVSKSALVRECLERGLQAEPFDNGLRRVAEELAPLAADVESVDDVDEYLYGSLGQNT